MTVRTPTWTLICLASSLICAMAVESVKADTVTVTSHHPGKTVGAQHVGKTVGSQHPGKTVGTQHSGRIVGGQQVGKTINIRPSLP